MYDRKEPHGDHKLHAAQENTEEKTCSGNRKMLITISNHHIPEPRKGEKEQG